MPRLDGARYDIKPIIKANIELRAISIPMTLSGVIDGISHIGEPMAAVSAPIKMLNNIISQCDNRLCFAKNLFNRSTGFKLG